MNHRGPLPLKELHSTEETLVWRDPGGSWACLPPVYDYVWIHPARGCDYLKQVSESESPRTPPLEGTSLHRRNTSVERPWGILSLFTACLPAVYDYVWIHPARGCDYVKQVSESESPRTPPLEATSLHRRNTSVERPWGILSLFTACLPAVYDYVWIHPARGCDYVKQVSESESPRTPSHEGTSLHRRNTSVERPFEILSLFTTCTITGEFTLPEALTQSGVFVNQVVFCLFFSLLFFLRRITVGSLDPLEGTGSPHRRNNSAERPWGILSLFMTVSEMYISLL